MCLEYGKWRSNRKVSMSMKRYLHLGGTYLCVRSFVLISIRWYLQMCGECKVWMFIFTNLLFVYLSHTHSLIHTHERENSHNQILHKNPGGGRSYNRTIKFTCSLFSLVAVVYTHWEIFVTKYEMTLCVCCWLLPLLRFPLRGQNSYICSWWCTFIVIIVVPVIAAAASGSANIVFIAIAVAFNLTLPNWHTMRLRQSYRIKSILYVTTYIYI